MSIFGNAGVTITQAGGVIAMDTKTLFEKLLHLNTYERIGRDYLQAYQREMDYGAFLYLMQQPSLREPVKAIASPSAQAEQKRLRQQFHSICKTELSAQDFIKTDKPFEMEQLLRYINIPAHRHDFVEMVCVLSGECVHLINNHQSVHHAGDMTLIPPGISHELHASPDCVCITTKFRTNTFLSFFSNLTRENSLLSAYFTQIMQLPFCSCALSMHGGTDPFIKDTILHMFYQQTQDKPYAQTIIQFMWQTLFSYYAQNYQETAEFLMYDTVKQKDMQTILIYIFENYQNITLVEAARHFHFSPSYLSNRIHELSGSTFSALLKKYKMQRASELLIQTNLPIEEICHEVGYSNTAHFIRSFKTQHGITPGQYRKENVTNQS